MPFFDVGFGPRIQNDFSKVSVYPINTIFKVSLWDPPNDSGPSRDLSVLQTVVRLVYRYYSVSLGSRYQWREVVDTGGGGRTPEAEGNDCSLRTTKYNVLHWRYPKFTDLRVGVSVRRRLESIIKDVSNRHGSSCCYYRLCNNKRL